MADVVSISAPQPEVEENETTHLDSTAAWREFLPGFIEPGELEATLRFGKAEFAVQHTTLMVGRVVYFWRVLLPLLSGESSNSRLDFQGFVMQFGLEEIEDDTINASLTVKCTGAVTWTSGS